MTASPNTSVSRVSVGGGHGVASDWSKRVGFVGTFVKLRKATVSSVMSVCLNGTTCFPVEFFMKFNNEDFSKICREN
jgi:hypothetical protein